MYMIHNPASWGGGTADQLSQEVETLRKIESDMAALYLAGIKKREKMNGKSDEDMTAQIKAWMNAETWFTAQEAVDYGFADEVVGADEQAATSAITAQITATNFKQYKNAPQRVVNIAAMANDKNKPGILEKIKNLLAGEETTETATETTETTDPIQAAKDLLAENGYSVTEATDDAPADEAATEEAPITNSAKTYTEEDIKKLITAALKNKEAEKKAGTSVTSKAAGEKSTSTTKADEIRAKAAKALAPLAKGLRGN